MHFSFVQEVIDIVTKIMVCNYNRIIYFGKLNFEHQLHCVVTYGNRELGLNGLIQKHIFTSILDA